MASRGTAYKKGRSWLDMRARDTRIMSKKHQVRGMATQTQATGQRAIRRINTPLDDTGDETYCLR